MKQLITVILAAVALVCGFARAVKYAYEKGEHKSISLHYAQYEYCETVVIVLPSNSEDNGLRINTAMDVLPVTGGCIALVPYAVYKTDTDIIVPAKPVHLFGNWALIERVPENKP